MRGGGLFDLGRLANHVQESHDECQGPNDDGRDRQRIIGTFGGHGFHELVLDSQALKVLNRKECSRFHRRNRVDEFSLDDVDNVELVVGAVIGPDVIGADGPFNTSVATVGGTVFEWKVREFDVLGVKAIGKVDDGNTVFGSRGHDKDGTAVLFNKGKVIGDTRVLVTSAVKVQFEIDQYLGGGTRGTGLENANGLPSVSGKEDDVFCEWNGTNQIGEKEILASNTNLHNNPCALSVCVCFSYFRWPRQRVFRSCRRPVCG